MTESKRQLLECAADVFDSTSITTKVGNEPDVKTLHATIGHLAIKNDFLSDALFQGEC